MTDDDRGGFASRDIQKVALGYGVVFLLVGIAGFIPGLTTGTLGFAGPMSGAKLLGLFQVSVLHNLLHLLYGVVGVVAAFNRTLSRYYLIWGGVLYLLLFVYGLIIQGTTGPANFVPLNDPDNWLHFALGVIMSGMGLFVGRSAPTDVPGQPRPSSR
jgi:Domain of unknown function (DUF4383)